MAYVGNVADALVFSLTLGEGTHVFNYADSPDYDVNGLVGHIYKCLGRSYRQAMKIPYPVALFAARCFDVAARLTRRTFPISAIRVEKFCANTQFNAEKIRDMGFVPRFSISEGLERTIQSEFLSN
jgi:nucleoside-diphosphate-sugar epimerase